ncbi:MAG TPA: hypothetical protein VLT33_49170, partial [Labilithrix sp.]|nr:hypothetical protein [Labilithrix sp.]
MSGFSIELLEEGYRAVDPLARVRFVVKRAPDDMALTPALDRPSAGPKGVAPAAPSAAAAAIPVAAKSAPGPSSTDQTLKNLPPTPSSSSANVNGTSAAAQKSPSIPPPRPVASPAATSTGPAAAPADEKKKAQTMVFASTGDASVADKAAVERAAPPAIGSPIPGLPAVKLLTSREQDPNEASPLTYREYAFV